MEVQGEPKCRGKLHYEQVEKLNVAYKTAIEVHGRGNFPTLNVTLQQLVQQMRKRLSTEGIPIRDVRLNGGVASYIVGDSNANCLSYNDVDLIFSVELDSEETLLSLKDLVLECLLEYFPSETNRDRLSIAALGDAYVSKLAKVWQPNGDKWSLITLSNYFGMNLELKFVDTMKRKFQFSVDSFQVILDSLTKFYDVSNENMTSDFYPSVIAESVFGDYDMALYHLNNKLIATHSPQDIRGGGLLKYCDLLSRGYQPAYSISEIEKLERLMCSRFFIDYPDCTAQYQKLSSYLANHFCGDYASMLPYLCELYRVVNESTVCLMGHERRQALELIQHTAFQVQCNFEQQQMDLEAIHGCYGIDAGLMDDTSCYSPISPPHIYGYPGIQHAY